MGPRHQRLEEICREETALLLASLEDPRLEGLEVFGVELAANLSRLRVVLVPGLEPEHPCEAVESALARATGHLRRELACSLGLKRTPVVVLRYAPDLAIPVDD